MSDFLSYFSQHRVGILLLLAIFIVGAGLSHWVSWIMNWGRFADVSAQPKGQSLRYIFSEAAVKIINDFRHLLALIVILIFAGALGYAMIRARNSLSDMKEALQAVVATLGGLVGSIIGYYFGESTAVKSADSTGDRDQAPRGKPSPAVQAMRPVRPPNAATDDPIEGETPAGQDEGS